MIGGGGLYFGVFLIIFNWDNRPRAYYYVFFLISCLTFMNLTKMAYSEPRPYFVDPDIIPHGCSAEYGNPSGHSLFAAAFFIFIFLDVFEHSKDILCIARIKPLYIGMLFLAISFMILIGFARLYVAVHSLN